MCRSNAQLHFCTCASTGKKLLPLQSDIKLNTTEYEKTYFVWTLYKYLGQTDGYMMGEMIMPVESLNEELTTTYLTQQLNSENRFDFEYTPKEGDNLQIKEEYTYKAIKANSRPELYDYMSFIYRNGTWKEEVYNIFSDRIRMFKNGKIQRISSE